MSAPGSNNGAQGSTSQLLNRLRMRQIALILAVDDLRTLRAAAGQLGLTQPAATKMLHELEDALGHRLFDRVGRGLKLNPAGARVTGHFRSIRGSMEALNRQLGEFRLGGVGKFSIGSIMAASPGRLTDAMLSLKREFPLLTIEIVIDTSDRLLTQLREGTLEIVVGRVTPLAGIECNFTAIEDEALVVVARNGHPLARKLPLDFGAMLDYAWVLQPQGSPMRAVIEREFRAHHHPLPQGLIETGSIPTTINLITRSDLLAVIPQAVAQRDAKHGVLCVLPYEFGQKLESYGSLVPKDRPLSRPAARFLELLHTECTVADE
jgi:DNA-binding transcriptional LysR family regulator